MNHLFHINCLWVGNKLGAIEEVCLLSMLRQGHQVRLFTYENVTNVPEGIDIISGNEIIPQAHFLIHSKTRSPALGSDIFRYKLQEKELGLWLDLDMLLLNPIPQLSHDFFGMQDEKVCNGAALYFRKHSPILKSLLHLVDTPFPVPPFLTLTKRHIVKIRGLLGFPQHVESMSWGVFGPKAITYFAKTHNLLEMAQKAEVLYPVHYLDAHGPFTSNWNTEKFITPNTKALHLWNEMLKKPSHIRPNASRHNFFIEKNSFVERYAREELGFLFK